MSVLTALALQSRFAPVPRGLHIIFCIFATILFIILYIRNKKLSDIYWLLICDTTLILQFYSDKITATVIGIFEVILLALVIIESHKEAKAMKSSEEPNKGDSESDIKELDELVKSERKAMLGESKVDIIADAFDTDDKNK